MARFTDDARQFKVYTNVAGRTTAPPNSRQRSVGVLQWPLSKEYEEVRLIFLLLTKDV
jgi:hypothetical protein